MGTRTSQGATKAWRVMGKMKAKYVGCTHDGWRHTELFYEYKGHEYTITKHNNGYMDKSMKQQHEEKQAEIDEMIAHENDPIPEWKYEGSAEEGFDLFWKEICEE